ncbi:MAG: NAD-dependent malic enzyme [Trueperaceae bacterium]|nr:NAD-dependent malic enzyme [Trueperaceae bacterium]
MKQYDYKFDDRGEAFLETDLDGLMLTRLPLLNKGSAFTKEERRAFKLDGLLPPHIASLEEQVENAYRNFTGFSQNLDKHVFLRALQDRNEVLFYALLDQHLEEMMPIIYTPTVAEAVQQFSHIYRFSRGLVVSTENIDHIDELLQNTPYPYIKLIVATDSEGILGIGDQGFGGMAICIGKLSLYTAAAGVDPALTLPVQLDVGTYRQDLLDDPLYLGVRHERLEGDAYAEFINKFVTGLKKHHPNVLLQWEDFSKQKAFDVLESYKDELPSFNDDIQGTGAVVLAGLIAASRKSLRKLSEEVYVIHGAGAGGVGVARQVAAGLMREGLSEKEAKDRIFMIDSRGLVLNDRKGLEPYKLEFAKSPSAVAGWTFEGQNPSLLDTVKNARVTVLLGLSGQRGAFNQEIIRAVDANTPYPMVFALSNPTVNSEAIPEDVYTWTEGRAIVATGSPFADVQYQGERYSIGQGNNAFIFPGVGLGIMLSGASKVTDRMLTEAAVAQAEYVSGSRLASGAVYPPISSLRSVSKRVAVAVIKQVQAEGLARVDIPEDIEGFVNEKMWRARYFPIRRP